MVTLILDQKVINKLSFYSHCCLVKADQLFIKNKIIFDIRFRNWTVVFHRLTAPSLGSLPVTDLFNRSRIFHKNFSFVQPVWNIIDLFMHINHFLRNYQLIKRCNKADTSARLFFFYLMSQSHYQMFALRGTYAILITLSSLTTFQSLISQCIDFRKRAWYVSKRQQNCAQLIRSKQIKGYLCENMRVVIQIFVTVFA